MMNVIVAYDIANPKRLARVAKIVKDYGHRVQKSIFEVKITKAKLKQLKSRIEREIVPEEDGVKYIFLCEKCFCTLDIIGQGEYLEQDPEYCVV